MAASLEGAGAAWRLLASLEGAALLLAASALLARAACARGKRPPPRTPAPRAVRSVLLTNATSTLGVEIKRSLELRGCTVSTATSDANGAGASGQVDALVVVGARAGGASGAGGDLPALAGLVSEDVHHNLKLLECSARRVRSGGRLCWASAAPPAGPLAAAAAAFHAVLRAALEHTAANVHCDAVWVQRSDGPQATAEHLVAALLSQDIPDPCTALR